MFGHTVSQLQNVVYDTDFLTSSLVVSSFHPLLRNLLPVTKSCIYCLPLNEETNFLQRLSLLKIIIGLKELQGHLHFQALRMRSDQKDLLLRARGT